MFRRIKQNKNLIIFIKSILDDILIVSMVAFFLATLGELMLPGIVSGKIGLEKIIIFILLTILIQSFLPSIESRSKFQGLKEKALGVAFWALGTIIVFGFLWKMGLAVGIFFAIIAVFISWGVYRLIFNEK